MSTSTRASPIRPRKAEHLLLRLDAASKRLLQRVAGLKGMSTSDYVRSLVIATAERDLGELQRSTVTLSASEQLAFWRALNEPVRLTAAQRKLGAMMRSLP